MTSTVRRCALPGLIAIVCAGCADRSSSLGATDDTTTTTAEGSTTAVPADDEAADGTGTTGSDGADSSGGAPSSGTFGTDETSGDETSDNETGDDETTGASTGGEAQQPVRVLFFVSSTHGAEGVWPIPRDAEDAPAPALSPVYAALDGVDAPMVFVEGVDNAVAFSGDGAGPHVEAMQQLLTSAALIDGVFGGPSIDQLIGELQEPAAPRGSTFFAGVARAEQEPAVYAPSGSPVTPWTDPVPTWESFVAAAADRGEDISGFPTFPRLDFRSFDDAIVPDVLAFHTAMAAELLRRRDTATAVLQLSHGEALFSVPWLGTDCSVQALYHQEATAELCDDAGVGWHDALAWTTGAVVQVVDAVAAKTLDDGTSLLDHTLIVWMQDYGTVAPHSLLDLPVVLIGGAALGGEGRRIVDAQGYDQADLAVSIAAVAGVEVGEFGDATHQSTTIPQLWP